jgi:hypothetical protein
VTPEDALFWLELAEEKGYINRGVSDAAVARLQSELEHKRWMQNGQPLIFRDKDGVPLDGYHRLWAVANSGVAARFDLRLGVPDCATITMDTGGKGGRTLQDFLKMEGVPHYNTTSIAVQLLAEYRKGILRNRVRKLHNHEYMEYYKKNKAISGSVKTCLPLKSVFGYIGTAAFSHYLFSKINGPLASDMILRLASGAALTNGSPVLALRERLIRQRFMERKDSKQRVARIQRDELVYLFFTAWNRMIRGVDVQRLNLPKRTANWEIPELFTS